MAICTFFLTVVPFFWALLLYLYLRPDVLRLQAALVRLGDALDSVNGTYEFCPPE